LVSKNRFRHIDSIIAGIEKRLDEQNGILDVTVESAVAADSAAEDTLKKMIRERTAAAAINMKMKTVPDLIAGYRLWIGGLCIDASLRGQLEHMMADLSDGGQHMC
jgi:F0F1-type ATP synthase delta subunit